MLLVLFLLSRSQKRPSSCKSRLYLKWRAHYCRALITDFSTMRWNLADLTNGTVRPRSLLTRKAWHLTNGISGKPWYHTLFPELQRTLRSWCPSPFSCTVKGRIFEGWSNLKNCVHTARTWRTLVFPGQTIWSTLWLYMPWRDSLSSRMSTT